mmetsp:Transcript_78588/g.197476  ORF Transcript_78588/g.197476 Transcript_78588/m.197476 type:complete len:81 (+) Transcript_78588:634-876(+)
MPCTHSLVMALFAFLFACCSYSSASNVGTCRSRVEQQMPWQNVSTSLRSRARIHWDIRVLLYGSDNDDCSEQELCCHVLH